MHKVVLPPMDVDDVDEMRRLTSSEVIGSFSKGNEDDNEEVKVAEVSWE